MQNDQFFKKVSAGKKKKVHNSIISPENRKFYSLFIKIIAYLWEEKKKKCTFKNYQPSEKFVSRITHEKSQTLLILSKIIAYFTQKIYQF